MPINPCRNSKCEYFNKSLPSNAKVCPMCGEALGNAFPPASAPPLIPTPVPTPIPTPVPAPISYASPSRPTLKLIHSTGREFYLPSEGGFIGRHSPSNPSIPEIDLVGIPEEGVVSRVHARLSWDANQNAYVIMDNSSRNGTSLNGMLLKPKIAYRVENGMSLQLGQDNLVNFRIVVS
jgi:hypothetical protein